MSAKLRTLAREKEFLVARSELCRLRLRLGTRDLRDSLRWNRAVVAAAGSPPVRRGAFDLALRFAGPGRAARAILLASRIVFLAKVARAVIGGVRALSASRANGPAILEPGPAALGDPAR